MVRLITALVMLVAALSMLALPVGAALIPMSWGFPQLVQENSATAFDRAFQNAAQVDTASVAFPTGDGVFSSAFPTITQTSDATALLSSMKFLNERQFMSFSYPYVSIGGSPILPMGFI